MKNTLLSAAALFLMLQGTVFAVDLSQVTVGGEVKMRGYYLENFYDFDDSDNIDEWSVLRLRARLFADFALDKNVTTYVRIANQNYGEGVTARQSDGDKWEEENKSNKFFVDAAYISVKSFFGLPLDVQIGRQYVVYGSGWVLFDGQSQFGSTSAYLDGLKFAWRIRNDVTMDALYFKDEENKRDNTTPDDITLAGLYVTSKYPLPTGQQEVYALNRNDETTGKDIYMFGARLSNGYDNGLDYSAEGAWQTGKFTHEIDQNAYGLKIDLGFRFKEIVSSPRFYGGFVRLTGDDKGTADRNEAWDVYYGGWPQYGDLLVWKYINAGPANAIAIYDPDYNAGSTVGGESVYSNFNMLTAGLEVRPVESLKAGFSYSKWTADETIDGIDKDLGDYYQLTAEYRYSKHLSLGLYAALIDPGDAFVGRNDPASEAFWDVSVNF